MYTTTTDTHLLQLFTKPWIPLYKKLLFFISASYLPSIR